MYIYEHKDWPSFSWDRALVGETLNKVHKAVGYLMGRLSMIGFEDKVSADTAARDIRDLVEKGILLPQQGRVRDVSYAIRCSDSILVVPMPADGNNG